MFPAKMLMVGVISGQYNRLEIHVCLEFHLLNVLG